MSVVSYLPAHEWRTSGLCTPPNVPEIYDPETGLLTRTLTQLINEGAGKPYIDNIDAIYSSILASEATTTNASPFTAGGTKINFGTTPAPKVAVIGCGMAGLLTAFQLAKAGLSVVAWDAYQPPYNVAVGNTGDVYGAGRIAPVLLSDEYTGYTQTGQLGAMRFPSNSFLFWHYMNVANVAAPSEKFLAFPNPLKVPSLFTYGEPSADGPTGSVTGVWDDRGYALPPVARTLQGNHIAKIFAYSPPGAPTGSGYTGTGGTMTVQDAAELVECKLARSNAVADVRQFWGAARAALYQKSYYQFLQERGFSGTDIDNIGYLGIGTGGFGPLFTRCALEIIRLFIWSYKNEFAVPKLGQLPGGLWDLGKNVPNNPVVYRHRTAVNALVYSKTNDTYKLKFDTGTAIGLSSEFDFVVLAMTSQAAKNLLSRSEAEFPRSEAQSNAPDPVYPFYDSTKAGFKSNIKRDLEGQNGMDSIKIFQTIYGPSDGNAVPGVLTMEPWQRVIPKASTNTYDTRVRVAFGRYDKNYQGYAPLGITYIMPMRDANNNAVPLATTRTLMALHYCWGAPETTAGEWKNDAVEVSNALLSARGALTTSINNTGKFEGSLGSNDYNYLRGHLLLAVASRFRNFNHFTGMVNPDPTRAFEQYFSTMWVSGREPKRAIAIVHWSKVPHIRMAFKLDRPGYGAFHIASHKISALGNVTTTAWDTRANGKYYVHRSVQKLFFTGDAASNYGGWVEGAFQSALATSAAVIRMAARENIEAWQAALNMPSITDVVNGAFWPDPNDSD